MLASLLFILALDPAVAATPAAPAQPATVAASRTIDAVGDPNKMICHNEETTGSRLGNVRICMTKAQWEDRSNQDSQSLKLTQSLSYRQ